MPRIFPELLLFGLDLLDNQSYGVRTSCSKAESLTFHGRKTTIILGNGAGCGAPSKVSRPRMNRISAAFRQNSWNHLVSVLAGSRATTTMPFWASSKDLRT